MHLDADDIAVLLEDFNLVQEEVFQAVRETILQMLLKLRNEGLLELAVPLRERRRGKPPAPPFVMKFRIRFSIENISPGLRLFLAKPRKKSCDASSRALSPSLGLL